MIVRDSYTFHEGFHDAMSELDDRQYGRIMRAINEFALYGKEPELNGVLKIVWKLIYPSLLKSRNKVNGKAGAPKNNKNSIKKQSKNNQTTIKKQSNDNQKTIKRQSNEIHDINNNVIVSQLNGGQELLKIVNGKNLYEEECKTKEDPPSPPQEIPPITPKEYPPISPQESTLSQRACACEGFLAWLQRECPYIYGHYKLPTEAEFLKLKQGNTSEEIAAVCSQIENRVDLRKRYSNLYRTLLNWLKNEKLKAHEAYQPNYSAADKRAADVAAAMSRLAAEG